MGRPRTYLIYTAEDWAIMERALLKASTKLERPPNDRFKSRLARRVMKLFDDGMRDDDVIASAAVFQERIVEGVIQKN